MPKPVRCALATLVVTLGLPAAALAAIGEFTFVTGEVALFKANGQRIETARGTPVDKGDRIVTGANGMAQLTMIDNARLSLRPNSDFRIEQYVTRPESDEGVILSLARGTLRTFTGLLSSTNRDKFLMKTRVATVGIRGSGNILHACVAAQCDPSLRGANADPNSDITVNHTIEGSHSITNNAGVPGMPPQQGGPQTIVTGPGQTVLVQGNNAPRNIPTPQFISDTAANPTGAAKGSATGQAASSGAATRNFAPGDVQGLPPQQQQAANNFVGNNGLGFVTVDASSNLGNDASNLQDVVIVNGGVISGQAAQADLALEGGNANRLRGYNSYNAGLVRIDPSITDGTLAESRTASLGGTTVVMGRWQGAGLGLFGSSGPAAGNVHWIYAPAGFPGYLSEVLTGTATYTLVAATSPTNQNNTAGTLGSATLDVNFSSRTLGLALAVSMPASGTNGGGSWNLNASNVPLSLNSFFASTGDRLVIVNGAGASSAANGNLSGSVEGSLVGGNLQGAILGYGVTDQTSTNPANHNVISGVAGLAGPAQNGAAPYREGRVSDPAGAIGLGFSRSYATTNPPDDVTSNAAGAVTSFVAPFGGLGRARFALGTAQVAQSGADPETGMVWGRWSGGTATVTGSGSPQPLGLSDRSLHYIFAGTQQGPVSLPLTGTAAYDVIGSTSPTDSAGHVGTLGSATLDVNFTNRTASSTVNVSVAGQSWSGSAGSMPIYRDQYFSASTGIPGIQNLSPLTVTCSPSCAAGAAGSFDGFFTGRTGQRAGMIYHLGPVQGAVAFGRRGG
jgi:hypothetical protein